MTDDSKTTPAQRAGAAQIKAPQAQAASRSRRKPRPENESQAVAPSVDENTSAAEPKVIVIGNEPDKEPASKHKDGLRKQVRQPLTVLFLMALVGGLTAEWLGGFYFPAMLMIIYFVVGLLIPKTMRNTEQFADSLYYLGFILTLGALFLAMTPGLNAEQISSENIIRKFGIAILTTFVGMSLRIILLQLRYTAADQEEEARESIARYVVSLQEELGATITEIREFRQGTFQDAADSASAFSKRMEEIAQSTDNAIASSRETMMNNLQAITSRIESSVQEIVDRLEKLDIPYDIITTRLQGAAHVLSTELEGLRASVSNSAASFTDSLADSVRAIGRIKADVESLDQAVASINQSVIEVAHMTRSSNKEFADAAREAGSSMQSFRKDAQALAEVLHEVQQRLNARTHAYEAGIADAAARVHTSAQSITEDARGFTSALTTSAKAIRDAIAEATQNERLG